VHEILGFDVVSRYNFFSFVSMMTEPASFFAEGSLAKASQHRHTCLGGADYLASGAPIRHTFTCVHPEWRFFVCCSRTLDLERQRERTSLLGQLETLLPSLVHRVCAKSSIVQPIRVYAVCYPRGPRTQRLLEGVQHPCYEVCSSLVS